MKRVIMIVLDSVGAGALPDADKYGDVGANTLGHIWEQAHPDLPYMEKMGLGRIEGLGYPVPEKTAGGVNLDFGEGALMVISDFINLSGKNPLTGPNLDAFGVRFPDMTYAMTRSLQELAAQVAEKQNIKLHKGVYCWMNGPCYESPAEIRMIRTLGADAVGMSTVPEIIVARHSGMDVLGLSCITNMAAGILDKALTEEEVLEVGRRVKHTFRALVDGVIEAL